MQSGTEQLFQSASQGDEAAVEALLVRYAPALEGYIRHNAGALVRARESAVDVAQSVCREVLESLRSGRLGFQGEAAFRGWLYRAAVMKLCKRQRFWQAQRRDAARDLAPVGGEASSVSPDLQQLALGDEPTPSQAAVRTEELEAFARAFSELPDRYRDVVRLHHVEGCTHSEIAERLEISEANSRMLLSRALGRLGTMLAGPTG